MFRAICVYLSFSLVFPPQVWAAAMQQEPSKAVASPATTAPSTEPGKTTVPAPAPAPAEVKGEEAVIGATENDPMRDPLQAFHLAAWKFAYLYRRWMPQFQVVGANGQNQGQAIDAKKFFQLFKPYATCGDPFAGKLPQNLAQLDESVYVPLLRGFATYLEKRRSEVRLDFTRRTSRTMLVGQAPVRSESGETCYPAAYREEAASLALDGVNSYSGLIAQLEQAGQELTRPHFEELVRLDRRFISRAEVTMWFNWLDDLLDQRPIFSLFYEMRGADHQAAYPQLAIPESLAKLLTGGVAREKERSLEIGRALRSSDSDILAAIEGAAQFSSCLANSRRVGANEKEDESVLCLTRSEDWDFVAPRTATLVSLYATSDAPEGIAYGVQLDALRKDRLQGLMSVYASVNALLGDRALPLPDACLQAPDVGPYRRYYNELIRFTEPRWWGGQLDAASHSLEASYRDGKVTPPLPVSEEFYERGQRLAKEVFTDATIRDTFKASGVVGVTDKPDRTIGPVTEKEYNETFDRVMAEYSFEDYMSESLAKTPWKNQYALRLSEKIRVWTFLFRDEFESIEDVNKRQELLRTRMPAIIRAVLVDTLRDYSLALALRVRNVLFEVREATIEEVWETHFRSGWEEELTLGAPNDDVQRIANQVLADLLRQSELNQKFDPKAIREGELKKYVSKVREKSRRSVQVKDTISYLHNLVGWQMGPTSFFPTSSTYDFAVAGGKDKRKFEPNQSIHLQIDDGQGHGLGSTMPPFDPSLNDQDDQDYLHLKKVLVGAAHSLRKDLTDRLKKIGYTDERVRQLFGAKNVPDVDHLVTLILSQFERIVAAEAGSDWLKVRENRRRALTPLDRAMTSGKLRSAYGEGRHRFAEYLYRSYFEPLLQAKSLKPQAEWEKDVAHRVAVVRGAELFIADPDAAKVTAVLTKFEPKLNAERALESASRKQQIAEFLSSTAREKHLENFAAWTKFLTGEPEKARGWMEQLEGFFHSVELKKLYTARFIALTEGQLAKILTILRQFEFPETYSPQVQALLTPAESTISEVWQGYPALDKNVRPQIQELVKRIAAKAKETGQIEVALFEERAGLLTLVDSMYPTWEAQVRERLTRLKAAVDKPEPSKMLLSYTDARALSVGGAFVRVDRFNPVKVRGLEIPAPRKVRVAGELWLLHQGIDQQVPLVRNEFFREFANVLLPDYETFRVALSERITALMVARGGSARYEMRIADDRISDIKEGIEQIHNERALRSEQGWKEQVVRRGSEGIKWMLSAGQADWERQAAVQEAELNKQLSIMTFRRQEAEKVWRYETQFARLLRNYFLSPDYAGEVPKAPEEIAKASELSKSEVEVEKVYAEYVQKLFLDSKKDPRGGEMALSAQQVFSGLNALVLGAERHARFVPSAADQFLSSLSQVIDRAMAHREVSEKRYFRAVDFMQRQPDLSPLKQPLAVMGKLWKELTPENKNSDLPNDVFAQPKEGIGFTFVPKFDEYMGYLTTQIASLREGLKPVLDKKQEASFDLVTRYWTVVERASVVFLDRSEQFGAEVSDDGKVVWFEHAPTPESYEDDKPEAPGIAQVLYAGRRSDVQLTQSLVAFLKRPAIAKETLDAAFKTNVPDDAVGRFRFLSALSPLERRAAFARLQKFLFDRQFSAEAPKFPAFGSAEEMNGHTWAVDLATLLITWRSMSERALGLGQLPNRDRLYPAVSTALIAKFVRHSNYRFDGNTLFRRTSTAQTESESIALFTKAPVRVQIRALNSIDAAFSSNARSAFSEARKSFAETAEIRTETGLEIVQPKFDFELAISSEFREETKNVQGSIRERELLFFLSEFENPVPPSDPQTAEAVAWMDYARGLGGKVLSKSVERFDFDPSIGAKEQASRFELWWDTVRGSIDLEKAYVGLKEAVAKGENLPLVDAAKPFIDRFKTIAEFNQSQELSQAKAVLTTSDQNGDKILHDHQGKGYLIPETYPYFLVHLGWNVDVKSVPMPAGVISHPLMPTEPQLAFFTRELVDLMGIDRRDFQGWQKLLADPKLVTPSLLLLLAESKLAKLVYASGSLQTSVDNVMVQNPVWGGKTYGFRPRPLADDQPWSSAKSPERSLLTSPLSFPEWLGRVESPAFTQLYRATASDAEKRPLSEALVVAELERGSQARLDAGVKKDGQENKTYSEDALHSRGEFLKNRKDWSAAHFGGTFSEARVKEFAAYLEKGGVVLDPAEMRLLLEVRDAVVHFDSILSESLPQYRNESFQVVPGAGNDIVQGVINTDDLWSDYQQALKRLAAQLYPSSGHSVPELHHIQNFGVNHFGSSNAGGALERRRIGVLSATHWAGVMAYEKLFKGLSQEQLERRQAALALIDNKLREDSQKRVALEDGVLTVARNTQKALEVYCSPEAQNLRQVRTLPELNEKRRFLLDAMKLPFGDHLMETFADFIFSVDENGKSQVPPSAIAWMRQVAQEEHEWNRTIDYIGTYGQTLGAMLLVGIVGQRINPSVSAWAMRGLMSRAGLLGAGILVTGLFGYSEYLQLKNDFVWAPEENAALIRARDTQFPSPEGMNAPAVPFMRDKTGMLVAFQQQGIDEVQRDKMRWGMHIFFATTIALPLVKPTMRFGSKAFEWMMARRMPNLAANMRFSGSLKKLGFDIKPEGAFRTAESVREYSSTEKLVDRLGELPGVTNVGTKRLRLSNETAEVYRKKAMADLQGLSRELGLSAESGVPTSFVDGGLNAGMNRLQKNVGMYIANQRILKKDALRFLRGIIARLEGNQPEMTADEIIQLFKGNIDPAAQHVPQLLEVFGITNISRRLTERVLTNGSQLRMMRETAELVQAHQQLLALHSPSILDNVLALQALHHRTVTRSELSLPTGKELARIPRDVAKVLKSAKNQAEKLARHIAEPLAGGDAYSEAYWLEVIRRTSSLMKSVSSGVRVGATPAERALIESFRSQIRALEAVHGNKFAQYVEMWMIDQGLVIPEIARMRMAQLNAVYQWWLVNREYVQQYANQGVKEVEDVLRGMVDPSHPLYNAFTHGISGNRPQLAARAGSTPVAMGGARKDNIFGAAQDLREIFNPEIWVVNPKVVRALASGDPRLMAEALVPVHVIEDATTGAVTARIAHPDAPKKPAPRRTTTVKDDLAATETRFGQLREEVDQMRARITSDLEQIAGDSATPLRKQMSEIDRAFAKVDGAGDLNTRYSVLVEMRERFRALGLQTRQAMVPEVVLRGGTQEARNEVLRALVSEQEQRIADQLRQWEIASGMPPSEELRAKLIELQQLRQEADAALAGKQFAQEAAVLNELFDALELTKRAVTKFVSQPPKGGWTAQTNAFLRNRVQQYRGALEHETARVASLGSTPTAADPDTMRNFLVRYGEAQSAGAVGNFDGEARALLRLNESLDAELNKMMQVPGMPSGRLAKRDQLYPNLARWQQKYDLTAEASKSFTSSQKKDLEALVRENAEALQPLQEALNSALKATDARLAAEPKATREALKTELMAEMNAVEGLEIELQQGLSRLDQLQHGFAEKSLKSKGLNAPKQAKDQALTEYRKLEAQVRTDNPNSEGLKSILADFDRVITQSEAKIVEAQETPGALIEINNLRRYLVEMNAELRRPHWRPVLKPKGRKLAVDLLPRAEFTPVAPLKPEPKALEAAASKGLAGVDAVAPMDENMFGLMHRAAEDVFKGAPDLAEAVGSMGNTADDSAVKYLQELVALPADAGIEQISAAKAKWVSRRVLEVSNRLTKVPPTDRADGITGVLERWGNSTKPQVSAMEVRLRLGLPPSGVVTEEALTGALSQAAAKGVDAESLKSSEALVRRVMMENSPGLNILGDVLAVAEMPTQLMLPRMADGLVAAAVTPEQRVASKMMEKLLAVKPNFVNQEAKTAALGLPAGATREQMLSRVGALQQSTEQMIQAESALGEELQDSVFLTALRRVEASLKTLRSKL